MKKIGVTATGSILVEMTAAQYDALVQMAAPGQMEDEPKASEEKNSIELPKATHAMAIKRKLTSVRSCILKLKPKNNEEVFRLIKSVYHQAGGISDTEVAQILKVLEREKFLGFNEDGTVNYVGGLISKPESEDQEDTPVKPLISA